MTVTTSYFQTTTFLLCHLHYLHIINNNNISLILSILLFSLSIYIKIRCFDLCPFSEVITYSLFSIYVLTFIIYVRKVVISGKKKGWWDIPPSDTVKRQGRIPPIPPRIPPTPRFSPRWNLATEMTSIFQIITFSSETLENSIFSKSFLCWNGNEKRTSRRMSVSVGGDKRDRTADLLNAIQALSQLSYTPE